MTDTDAPHACSTCRRAPRLPRYLAETLPGEPWSTYPGFNREAIGAVRGYEWTDGEREIDLTAIDIPVLAIVGEYDGPNRRTHRMQREIADFQRVILEGENHGSSHFNPLYTEAMVEFVREHDPEM